MSSYKSSEKEAVPADRKTQHSSDKTSTAEKSPDNLPPDHAGNESRPTETTKPDGATRFMDTTKAPESRVGQPHYKAGQHVPTKKFRVNEPYFRNQAGRLYHAGEVVEVPHDEPPAKNWTELNEDGTEKEGEKDRPRQATQATTGNRSEQDVARQAVKDAVKRASDKDAL